MAYGNLHNYLVLQRNEVITTKNYKGERIMIIGLLIMLIIFIYAIHHPNF